MAEIGQLRPRRRGGARGRFSPDDIASRLMPARDRLVDQVPVELAAARGMPRDQWELAVDEAIDYLALEYDVPIYSQDELERAFWWSTSLRVKRMRDGRAATVRGRFKRVDIDDVEIVAADGEPEAVLIEESERAALREFVATLTEREQQVMACKYGGEREAGRVLISRQLGLGIGEVRSAEAAIKQKLERFVAIMSAGRLCAYRAQTLAALGTAGLSDEAAHAARVHLDSCPACRIEHAARLRALRAGKLPHEIANLLPLPSTAAAARGPRTIWDGIVEWTSRLLPHDSAVTGTQIGLASRGLGSLAAAKLAALCIGGVALVGGALYCVSGPLSHHDPPHEPRHALRVRTAKVVHTAAEPSSPVLAKELHGKAIAAPTATPKPHVRPKTHPRVTPTTHEHETAVSPAAAKSQPNGASEFGPTSTGSTTPPAKAVTSGGPEFP
jgi:hypothetical protein